MGQEPPLVDEINHIVVGVTEIFKWKPHTSQMQADMMSLIKYGGVTKSHDFVPSEADGTNRDSSNGRLL
jgi:hypothetical protein